MQKKRQYVPVLSTLLTVGVLLAASSCKKVDIDFGGQYVNNENTRVIKVDTITPVVTTVYVDTFSTAGTGVGLIGSHADPLFGKSTASTYFEYAPPTGITLDEGAQFDSIILVLKPNKTYYGDTTSSLHVSVRELNEEIIPVRPGATTYSTLFNTTSFSKKAGLLNINNVPATISDIRPSTTDTIVVRLNNQFGANLFELLKSNAENMKSTERFITEVLKGVFISSNADDKLIMGIKDSVDMRLYYTNPGPGVKQTYLTFNMANTAHQFNHIDIDRTGTPLGNAGFDKNNQVIASENLDNRAFLQYITGSMIKIQFPTVKASLQNAPDYFSILSATLKVRPVLGTYSGVYKTLPSALRLSRTDRNNLLGADLYSSTSTSQQLQTGNLIVNDIEFKATGYTYDLTSYLLEQIATVSPVIGNGLLLAPPSPNHVTGFNRLVTGNAKNENGQMVLTVYYLAINK